MCIYLLKCVILIEFIYTYHEYITTSGIFFTIICVNKKNFMGFMRLLID